MKRSQNEVFNTIRTKNHQFNSRSSAFNMSLSIINLLQRRFINRSMVGIKGSFSMHQSPFQLSSRTFRMNQNTNIATGFADGPEISNFSEKTLQWMVDRTESHIDANIGKYPFGKDEVKMLSHSPTNGKALVSCTAQNTSTWFINNLLSRKEDIYVHSFTESGSFEPLRHLFSVDAVPLEKDGVMALYDESRNLGIEHADIRKLGAEWVARHGFNEYFDVIFDELPLDTMVLMDDYIQTTIYGHCLKRGGVIYVCSKKISGDIAGRKLRQKIGSLYGNSHFEMIGERDSAWHTQFLFLKAESCSNVDSDRESLRKDHWGDSHLEYNQHKIWNRSKVTENAGRGMTEGMERVYNALMDDVHDGKAPEKRDSSIRPSYLEEGGDTFHGMDAPINHRTQYQAPVKRKSSRTNTLCLKPRSTKPRAYRRLPSMSYGDEFLERLRKEASKVESL